MSDGSHTDGHEDLHPDLSPILRFALSEYTGRAHPDPQSPRQYFRTSIVMPASRSLPAEKEMRMARRRDINQLAMRVRIAALGGILGNLEKDSGSVEQAETDKEASTPFSKLWTQWGAALEEWADVCRFADKAVASATAAETSEEHTLNPTPVTWSAVAEAMANDKASQEAMELLFKPPSVTADSQIEQSDKPEDEAAKKLAVDDVVKNVKKADNLDSYEQDLLPCIVDIASLSTTFKQVHLSPETIDAVRTIASLPLLFPKAFQQGILREQRMSGCLLFGPPGTDKTLLVRALAKEAGCRMLAITSADIMSKWVGEHEKIVRAAFSLARRLSPCIIFVDEIDALFGSRTTCTQPWYRAVITQFMQEMDGLKSSVKDGVIVVGATNRPFDLDDAVLRRFPRRMLVDLPAQNDREEILRILLCDENLAPDVNLRAIASQTRNFSGSDLKHLCVSAALDVVKQTVELPWRTSRMASTTVKTESPSQAAGISVDATKEGNVHDAPQRPSAEPVKRVLASSHFQTALKEVSASTAESLGSVAELRKWNEKFGQKREKRMMESTSWNQFLPNIRHPGDTLRPDN
ncbi:hypothetical protein CERSUDRAFT_119622 [Gelatoporia subvermispora B]|uniref:AAA+ ATPase domain-containing protein n=1 Tax=Ceriporiopsis subvermispora (strain B) TaxID=914234 RepID=M2QYH1_CERS8|nr:hypothetical protein CERSUDRAFT_119622 [Gelatoporia subvermispora B]